MKKSNSWNRLLSIALCLCIILSMIPGIPLIAHGASSGSYELVTDISQIRSGGQFVIVAQNNGSAMALGTTISSKITSVAVTVSGNTLSGSNLPIWTLEASGNGIALNNGSKYLGYSSSTNFASSGSAYEWSVKAGTKGGFILNSASSARGIYYQISSSRFGAYATSNATSSSYISELHLYKYTSGSGNITVYFQNNWLWTDIALHFWGSQSTADTQWPGNAMTLLGNNGSYDIYSLEIPSDIGGMIISGNKSDNSGRDQTPDITGGWFDGIVYTMHWDNGNQVTTGKITDIGLPCSHKAQTVAGKAPTCTETGLSEGSKCSLCGVTLKQQETLPATGHSFTDETCKVCGSARYTTVYFRNNWKWSNVRLYFWGSTSDAEPTWPGKAAEYYGFDGEYDIYTMKVPNDATGMLINGDKDDGSGLDKTPDITSGWFDGILYSMAYDNGNQVTTGKISDVGLQCSHKAQTVPGKAPTCTATGLTEGSKCSLCGVTLKAQQSIPATGHTKKTIPGKAATCTATGLTEGVNCSVCGAVITAQKTIPTTPHTEQTIPGKAATCTATGLTDGSKCKTCGQVVKAQETIPTIPHSYKTDTCQVCGTARYTTVYFRNNWKWSNVRLYYWGSVSDAEALWPGKDAEYYGFDGEYDIYTMKVPNDASGFLVNGDKDDGSGLDKTPDITTGWFDGILYSMVYTDGNQVTIGKISDVGLQCPHKTQTLPSKEPTCTEDGLTEGSKCSLCGAVLKAQQTIPATGHSFKNDTCTTCGYARYTTVYFRNNWKWSNVRLYYWGSISDAEALWPGKDAEYYGFDGEYDIYTMKVPNDATGFLVNGDKEDGSGLDKTPDITEGWFDGILYSMIYNEGNQVTTGKIDDIGLQCPHKAQTIPAKNPTCTEDGMTEGSKCSLCGAVLKAQQTVPATGHQEKTIPGKTATCTEDGLTEGKKCTVCNKVTVAQKTIPATGHNFSGDSCKNCGFTQYVNIYFRNNWLWTDVKLYFWGSTTDTNPDWPGKAMVYHGFDGNYDIYTLKVPGDITGMIICGTMSDGSNLDQTPDITSGWFDGILYSMEWNNGNQVTIGKIGDIGLQCPHEAVTVPAKAPTCTETGLTEGSKCSLCGAVLQAQQTIPATGHTKKTIPAKAATCTESGLTEGSVCTVCGETVVAQKTIPATGHNFSGDTCKTCGGARYTTVYFRNNWEWTDVRLYFWGSTSDAEPEWPGNTVERYGFDGSYDIYTMKVPNDATGFLVTGQKADGSGLDKTPDITEGWFDGILYSMTWDNGNQVTTGKIGDVGLQCPHKAQTLPGKAPTCTAAGLTEGSKCSLCGEILKAQQAIPATGHTKKTIPGKAATCTATGLTEGVNCSVCGTVITAQQTIPVKAHTKKTIPGKAATCTATGLTEGSKCSVCGEILKAQEIIPTTDHNYSGDTCKVCGSARYLYVYFRNNWLWTNVKIHFWGSTSDINPTWPGYAMEYYGFDGNYEIYALKIPTDITGLIICGNNADGSALDQTPDITDGWFNGIVYSMTWDNGNQVTTGKIGDIGLQCPHQEKVIPSKEPTCTESGLTEGTECTLCGATLTAQKTIPATGHNFSGDTCKTCGTARYMHIYFLNNWLWNDITLYYWGSTSDTDPQWPGNAMTAFGFDGEYDIYVLKVPADITGMLIAGNKSDGSGIDQTPDIEKGWFDGIVYSMTWDNGNQVTTGKIGDIGLQCPHKEVSIPAKAPTCTATGLTEGTKCSLCGLVLKAQQSVPATGHTEKTIPGKAATCTEEGLSEGKKCTVCNKVTVAQKTIPATGHRFSGNNCDLCGASGYITVYFQNNWQWTDVTLYYWGSSIGDNPSWPGYPMEYYGFDGTYSIHSLKIPVDIQGMLFSGNMADGSGTDQSCDITEGWSNGVLYSMTWNNGNQVNVGKISDIGLKCPHEEVTIPGKAPTCTETGLSEGIKCAICGETLTAQKTIPATGHKYTGDSCDLCGIARYMHIYFRNARAWTNVCLYFWGSTSDAEPTWPGNTMTHFGYDGEYDIYVLKVPTDIAGLLFDGTYTASSLLEQTPDITEGWFDGIVYSVNRDDETKITTGNIGDIGLKCPHKAETVPAKAPTCTREGLTEGSKCSLCGEVLKAQQSIPATGHTEETIPGKAATCTEDGMTSGTKCTTCGEIVKAQKKLPATGHRFTGNKCDVCGSLGYLTVYFRNNWLWTDITVYYWGSNTDTPEWPGHAMEFYKNDGTYDVYSVKIPVDIQGMLFSGNMADGSGMDQSCDIMSGWFEGVMYSMHWDNGNRVTIGKIDDIDQGCSHKTEILPGKAPTCTTDGLTEGSKCTLCGEIVKAQQTIPATGHSFSDDICQLCGYTQYLSIYFQNNWLWTDITVYYWGSSTQADPNWPGYAMSYYKNDGTYDIYTYKIPKDIQGLIFSGTMADGSGMDQSCDITEGWFDGVLYSMHWDNGNQVIAGNINNPGQSCSHKPETIPGKGATCTANGLTEGIKCSICGEILTEQKTIPAIGHNFSGGSCTVCGAADPNAPGETGYVLVTDISQILAGGQFIIIANNNGSAMALGTSISSKIGAVAVTVNGNTITGTDLPVWILKPTSNGVALYNGSSYLGYISSTNFAASDSPYEWGVTAGSNGGFILNSTSATRGIYYQISGNRFGAYAQSNAGKAEYISQLQLYKLADGSDTPEACRHTQQSTIPGKAATCTEDGLTEGKQCTACGEILTTQETIPATGHHFTGNTCDWCGITNGNSNEITIYFKNNWLWTDITLYYWGSSNGTDPNWPGYSMEYYKNDGTYDIYSFKIPSDIQGLIFSGTMADGSGIDQSCDITEGWFDGVLYSMHWDNGNQIIQEDINSLNRENLAFTSAGLTLYDDLTITFKADQSVIDSYTNVYAVFVLDGKTTIVRDYTLKDGKYIFPFRNIAPYRMNDTVTATLYGTYNGIEYASEVAQYSVATYCYNMLGKYNSNSYAKFRTLLVDLLNYGAASQMYVSYNTGSLVNANLTAAQKAWATATNRSWTSVQDLEYSTITSPSVQWKGGGLVLKESISMRFKIRVSSIDGLTVKVVTKDGNEAIVDSFEATDDGCYYFYFRGLNAAQMSDAVTLTVYKGNTPVSNTIRYSIESYAYSQQNGSNASLVQLLQAMMKYGDAARNYVGK